MPVKNVSLSLKILEDKYSEEEEGEDYQKRRLVAGN